MKGFLGDAIRLYWASLYWNLRKTAFRLRRGRGRRPCQHESDSGLANRTACAAIVHWSEPNRFRRVCPLLRQLPNGAWRCSVDAADVRSFWKRAAALYAATALALVLAAVVGCYAIMRSVGYDVSPRQIVWPPAWSELSRVRSDYFLKQADRYAAQGKTKESLLSLYNAYELDPLNYAAGLRLAQLWQVTQVQQSDALYERLMRDHPDRRSATAQLWLRALLSRADYAAAEDLAAGQLRDRASPMTAWLHAVVFSSERAGSPDFLNQLLSDPRLPPPAAPTLRLAAETRGLSPADQRARLIRAYLNRQPDAYGALYIGRRLLRLGYADEALSLTLRADCPLAERERLLLRLDALAGLGREQDRSVIVERILQAPVTDATARLLAVHLIRSPDARLCGLLLDDAASASLDYETRLALFCVAGRTGDATRLDLAANAIRKAGGGAFTTLDFVERFFLNRAAEGRHVARILPILQPLPLEVLYAMLETDPQA